MYNPICPNCGFEMEFDDHVQLGFQEYDGARLYLCPNDDCGKSLYEPYGEAELERSRLEFCRKMIDKSNVYWHFDIDLRGDAEQYEGLAAHYTVSSLNGETEIASGYIAVDSRYTGVHPYHPVESLYELVDMDIWRIFAVIQNLSATSQHVLASTSDRLNDFMFGNEELVLVKNRILAALHSFNNN